MNIDSYIRHWASLITEDVEDNGSRKQKDWNTEKDTVGDQLFDKDNCDVSSLSQLISEFEKYDQNMRLLVFISMNKNPESWESRYYTDHIYGVYHRKEDNAFVLEYGEDVYYGSKFQEPMTVGGILKHAKKYLKDRGDLKIDVCSYDSDKYGIGNIKSIVPLNWTTYFGERGVDDSYLCFRCEKH